MLGSHCLTNQSVPNASWKSIPGEELNKLNYVSFTIAYAYHSVMVFYHTGILLWLAWCPTAHSRLPLLMEVSLILPFNFDTWPLEPKCKNLPTSLSVRFYSCGMNFESAMLSCEQKIKTHRSIPRTGVQSKQIAIGRLTSPVLRPILFRLGRFWSTERWKKPIILKSIKVPLKVVDRAKWIILPGEDLWNSPIGMLVKDDVTSNLFAFGFFLCLHGWEVAVLRFAEVSFVRLTR